jgi:hypothetical protein
MVSIPRSLACPPINRRARTHTHSLDSATHTTSTHTSTRAHRVRTNCTPWDVWVQGSPRAAYGRAAPRLPLESMEKSRPPASAQLCVCVCGDETSSTPRLAAPSRSDVGTPFALNDAEAFSKARRCDQLGHAGCPRAELHAVHAALSTFSATLLWQRCFPHHCRIFHDMSWYMEFII